MISVLLVTTLFQGFAIDGGKEPGTKVNVTDRRDGSDKTVELTLRDLR